MNKQTILIMSGDIAWVRLTRYHLEAAQYQVVHADGGAVGLGMVPQIGPDLVLLDWRLPDLSPLAVTRTLRIDPSYNKLPILLSGRAMSSEDKMLSLEAGADSCLEESVHPKEFVARVRALLRRVKDWKVQDEGYGSRCSGQ